jgi:hypothetical protein
LKKLKLSEHSELYYFLNNAHGIISILLERGLDKDKKKGLESGDEADGVQYFTPLRDMLRKKLRSMQSVRTQLPIRGDFYPLGEATVLLYGPVKGANSRDAYAFTRGLVEDLDRKATSFQEELDREFARLHALLFELQGEEAGKTKAGKKALIAGKLSGMPEGVTLPKIGEVGGTRKDTASKEATTAEERQAYTTAPVQHVSYARGLSGPFKFIIPAAVVAIAALFLILFFFFPQVIGRRKPGEMGDTDIAATQEAVTEQDEGSFEADEFLEEKGIPQSALTDRMTVIYRGVIEITILDIFLLTNEIAVTNGFRRLDSIEETGRDPDWIYPENLFVLPDSTRYTVVKGDTMWYIAHRFIIKRLEEDWDRYMSIKNEAETTTPDAQRKEILIRELKSIGARSYSENFRREIDSVLETL